LNEEAANLNPWQGGQGSAAASSSQQTSHASTGSSASGSGSTSPPPVLPFKYRHLGSMATVGGTNAVLQLGGAGTGPGGDGFKIGRRRFSIAGFISWVAWRSAYLTRLGTMRARLQVAFDWTVTIL
jgi:NADH:ubiquinone reductase (non-electrogenic)